MNAATYAMLKGWRDEIASEISELADEVTAAQGVLTLAEIAAHQEADRVRDITAAFATLMARRPDFIMATALRDRMLEATKFKPTAATCKHAGALASAQVRLADAHAAVDQLDVLLRPPSLAQVAAMDSQAAVPGQPPAYEPIMMAMKVAG